MDIVTQVTGVFTEISTWITTTLPSIVAVFYDAETGLTFFGTLAVVGLAVAVFFLLMGVIQNFLHLRG